MTEPTAPTALEGLDALLRLGGIQPMTDRDGSNLVFLHIDCVSISTADEHYTLEHLDDNGDRLRRIRCVHEQIHEVTWLVYAYRDQPHSHEHANARPCLHLVKGRQR